MYLSNIKSKIQKHNKNVKNGGFYFASSLLGMIINLIINPFIALNMTHKDFAITGYFASFNSLLLPFISFSFISYYSRKYFYLDNTQREHLRNTILIALVWFSLICSMLSMILLYLYFIKKNVSFSFYPYALLSIANIFFTNFYTFRLVDLKLKREVKKYFKLSLFRSIIAAFFVVFLVIIIKGGALGKMMAASLSALFFGLYDLRKLLTKWEFDSKLFGDALRFCWPLSLAAMLNYFLSGVDRVMLEPLGDVQKLGLYNIALSIVGYLAIFNTTLDNTFQPDILQSIAEKKKKKTIIIIGCILLMNTIPILLFIVFAPTLIRILTYNRYTDAADFARILSLSSITNTLYFSMSTILIGYGFSKITLWNKILGTVICYALFKHLINSYGFFGAAWGQVFSFLIMAVLSVIFLFNKIKKMKIKLNFSQL
jgi:O-antigen/teichoic acid export membrane protein